MNNNVVSNEKTTAEQKLPVGYFTYQNSKWFFVNQRLSSLKDVIEDKVVPIGSMVELNECEKLLLSKEEGGRVVAISLVNK